VSETHQLLFSRAEFLDLAEQAGFRVSEEDLDELVRRNLLRPWEPRSSRAPQAHFHRLHLFVLASYFDAVRATRHPWGAVVPTVGLPEIAGLAKECRDLIGLLVEREAGDDTDAVGPEFQELVTTWAQALGVRASQINPFGPLQGVIALLSEDARAQLRGDGLLYLTFAQLADAFQALASHGQSFAQPVEASLAQAEEAPEVVEAPEVAEAQVSPAEVDVRETVEQAAVLRDAVESEAEPELSEVSWGEDEVTAFDDARSRRALQQEDAVLDFEPQAESTPQVAEAPHGFSSDYVEVTSRSESLQSRLARLRRQDETEKSEVVAQEVAAEEEIAQEVVADEVVPQEAQVEAKGADEYVLNELVLDDELFDDELFDDPAEGARPLTEIASAEIDAAPEPEEPAHLSELDDIFDEALGDADFLDDSQAFDEAELVEQSEQVEDIGEPESKPEREVEPEPQPEAEAPDADEQTVEAAHRELQARTDRLNQLRRTYLAEQRWEELVELYEDGLDLFVDPAERQRVFLTLALLYEVKLKQADLAFEQFAQAYELGGDAQGLAKAFEGMHRLGAQPPLQSRWSEFLEAQLGREELAGAERAELQRHHALVLHALGAGQRAFYTYTAFLADAHFEQLDERAFDDLERLAAGVDTDELGDIYADLLGNTLPDEAFERMALRAARHHADEGEVGLAMEYYERVLKRFPRHEVAFHSLGQLYEDAARWVPLKALYQARVELSGEGGSGALRSELERIERLMQAGATSN